MFKLNVTIFAAICLLTTISSADESSIIEGGKKIASCSGVITEIDVQLELFQRIDTDENTTVENNGYYIQSFGQFGSFPSAALKITNTEKGKTFELSVMGAPGVPFAKFNLLGKGQTEVDIFAINMGNEKWGTFKCQVVE